MRDISRRMNTVEKKLGLGKHENLTILMPPVLCGSPTNPTGRNYEELGPTETWFTYQEQLQAQIKDYDKCLKHGVPSVIMSPPVIIDLDIEKEYQARATKNNQKQPNNEK